MGIRKRGKLIASVAAIILVIVGAFVVSIYKPFGGDEKAIAIGKIEKVYPERGNADSIVITKTGMPVCDDKVASTELADSKGTVSFNGLLIKSVWDKLTVTISFTNGIPPFVSGYVVGKNGAEPFNMPNLPAKEVKGILLDTADFSKSGQLETIVLCGGGM